MSSSPLIPPKDKGKNKKKLNCVVRYSKSKEMDTDPNRNNIKSGSVVRYTNNRPPGKPVSLNQTPPPPLNPHNGRHPSHLYMVDQSTLRLGGNQNIHATPGRARIFTRSNSEPGQPSVQQPRDIFSLQARSGPRVGNEYVDSPQSRQTSYPSSRHSTVSSVKKHNSQNEISQSLIQPIVSQPKSFTKPPVEDDHGDSIICIRCNKCKCEKCQTPRELPKTWVCKKRYELSAQKFLEYCTCLCCVQFCFQTVFNDPEDQDDVADHPCACFTQRHCCKRWLCMGISSICLPGLCFYPCGKGCLVLANKCYNGCTNQGCQCHKDRPSGPNSHLLESERSSST